MLPLPNTLLEVWHLSPNSTKFKHKAQLKTNENGEYQFITDFPNKEVGKMPRIYFKISTNNDSYFTEVSITDFGAYVSDIHWTRNNKSFVVLNISPAFSIPTPSPASNCLINSFNCAT